MKNSYVSFFFMVLSFTSGASLYTLGSIDFQYRNNNYFIDGELVRTLIILLFIPHVHAREKKFLHY